MAGKATKDNGAQEQPRPRLFNGIIVGECGTTYTFKDGAIVFEDIDNDRANLAEELSNHRKFVEELRERQRNTAIRDDAMYEGLLVEREELQARVHRIDLRIKAIGRVPPSDSVTNQH